MELSSFAAGVYQWESAMACGLGQRLFMKQGKNWISRGSSGYRESSWPHGWVNIPLVSSSLSSPTALSIESEGSDESTGFKDRLPCSGGLGKEGFKVREISTLSLHSEPSECDQTYGGGCVCTVNTWGCFL